MRDRLGSIHGGSSARSHLFLLSDQGVVYASLLSHTGQKWQSCLLRGVVILRLIQAASGAVSRFTLRILRSLMGSLSEFDRLLCHCGMQ